MSYCLIGMKVLLECSVTSKVGTLGDGVCGSLLGRGVGTLAGCREGLGEWIIATAKEVALMTRSPMMEVVA